MTNQSANSNELSAHVSTSGPIIGIGATSGVIALKQFFQALPERMGLAFVLVMHLPAHSKRKLVEALQAYTLNAPFPV